MAKRYHGEMQYEVSEGESVVGALTRMERLRAFILGRYKQKISRPRLKRTYIESYRIIKHLNSKNIF